MSLSVTAAVMLSVTFLFVAVRLFVHPLTGLREKFSSCFCKKYRIMDYDREKELTTFYG